ncbi:MAG: glycosyltransferase family 2 protein [Rhodocyclaceae bacterium]|nr:glycosyltransferase family 2 protein [Rhodocyclaceae bacterium]
MTFEATCAVVVTYKYPYQELGTLLDLLVGRVGKLVLVDNNPGGANAERDALLRRYSAVQLVDNGANLGLATALNQGIRIALDGGFGRVLLFDQDSRPGADMLDRLVEAADALGHEAPPIAAVGPVIVDERLRGPLPFIRFCAGRVLKQQPAPGGSSCLESDMLITSGCLIEAAVLREIGLMDERLFIDNVDLEWCFRARHAGYRLVGVEAAILQHRLGDRVRRVPFLQRNILVHGPLRQYYITRNRIWLYWRPYIPWAWKLADFPRLLFKLVYFPLLVAPRGENLKMLARGLWDGVWRR